MNRAHLLLVVESDEEYLLSGVLVGKRHFSVLFGSQSKSSRRFLTFIICFQHDLRRDDPTFPYYDRVLLGIVFKRKPYYHEAK